MLSYSQILTLPKERLRKIRTGLGMHQGVLDPLGQSLGINLENIVDLANATRGKSLLVNVNVTVIRATITSVHIKVN
jgi:hypothetical protein